MEEGEGPQRGGRGQRQAAVVGRGGVKVKSALQELAEARKSGAKRSDRFDVKDEEAVYDMVDDAEYAKIVQKRREEGGEQAAGGVLGGGVEPGEGGAPPQAASSLPLPACPSPPSQAAS